MVLGDPVDDQMTSVDVSAHGGREFAMLARRRGIAGDQFANPRQLVH